MAAEEVAIPEVEAVELGAVRGIERRQLSVEVVRVEQARLQLGDRREERVGEAAEPGRPSETVQRLARERAPNDQRPLCLAGDRARAGAAARDPVEDVVERADRAGQERRLQLEQVALDPLDVRAVRHDQEPFIGQGRQVTPQQERHLPGVRRSGDQGQTHN